MPADGAPDVSVEVVVGAHMAVPGHCLGRGRGSVDGNREREKKVGDRIGGFVGQRRFGLGLESGLLGKRKGEER